MSSKLLLYGIFFQILFTGMLMASNSVAQKKSVKEVYINIEARNVFTSRINCMKIKYCYGFNAVGKRDNKINNSTTEIEYPRCGSEEIWKYIIQYSNNRIKRVEFIYQLE